MITELLLENFLFIRAARLEFTSGFNIITGETGAGKSILLEAIKLLLGKKGKTGLVLPGTRESRIQALFNLHAIPRLRDILSERGLASEDDPEQLLISRTFKPEGTGKTFINGILTNASQLHEIGQHLMEIHGQNEHQTLLDPDVQRRLLDRFGGDKHLHRLSQLAETYQQRRSLQRELDELHQKIAEGSARLEELQERLQLLEELALKSPDEETRLREELARLENREQRAAAIDSALRQFEGGDDESGILEKLRRTRESMRLLVDFDPEYREIAERLESLSFEMDDIRTLLSRRNTDEDYSPERLTYLQNRVHDLARAGRRFHTDGAGLFALLTEITEEIALLTSPDTAIDKKKAEFDAVADKSHRQLREVSADRKKIAGKLEKLVSGEMAYLGFHAAEFTARLISADPGEQGAENVEFMVRLNPGAPPAPLRKVASGGEVSRLALALKTVLAKGDDMPTMLFDEIDTGIGGETALAVAKSLAGLGRSKQILVVSHLHQIARTADTHFTVTKSVSGDSTQIDINRIQGDQREREIARMLGSTGKEGLEFARTILTHTA
jgi:DNA repair protein RecN (Recombination protein N)